MSHASLKLVATDPVDRDVLPFERRSARRRNLRGRVTSVQKYGDSASPINKIDSLELLDISDTGLGALAGQQIELGSSISVMFPAHGPEQGFDRFGYVVRCDRRDKGYLIGVRFAMKAAA